MKKLLAFMLVLAMTACLFTACGSSKSEDASAEKYGEGWEFKHGFDRDFPPYSHIDDNGETTGFDVELAQAVADYYGWEYKGVPISEIKSMSLSEFMTLENDDESKEEIPGKILLESEIRDLEEQAVKLETERKRWLAKHHDTAEEMGRLEEELESLREKIVTLKRKYNNLAERDTRIVAKANEALEKQHEVKAELEEKRRKLDEMLKIVICAYTDGTIAPMDESVTVNLDDTGADTLYQELVNREECQELKMREIRTLSKLLKIVENSTLEFEVVCDTAEMEAAYHALAVSADSTK